MIRQRDDDYDFDSYEKSAKIYRREIKYNIYDYMHPADKNTYVWISNLCVMMQQYLQEAMPVIFSYNKYAYVPNILISGNYITNLLKHFFRHDMEFYATSSIEICIFLIDNDDNAEIKTIDNEAIIPSRIWSRILDYTFKKIAQAGYDVTNYNQCENNVGKYCVTINGIIFDIHTRRKLENMFDKMANFTVYTDMNGFLNTQNGISVCEVIENIKKI